MTKTEKAIQFLKSKGLVEICGKSTKYRTFKKPVGSTLYFVGKAGAIRKGRTVSESVSVSDQIHAYIKEIEE